jgi:membrane associated rhomboid family serine protease
MNYLIICVNTIIFIYEILLGTQLDRFLFKYGLVPIYFIAAFKIEEISVWSAFVPFFTSMFLHGGWMHLIGNMWFLYVFGDNVEDKLGHIKYLFFYISCGVIAAVSQLIISWGSRVPMIGASGAIAGVLGAYMILFPHSRVLTLVPIFVFIQLVEIPAFVFLFLWFVMQFFYGAVSFVAISQGGVAWWAHIGGFVAGIFLIRVLRGRWY